MSRVVEVECPSGLVVAIREFKVKDEDLLADPQNIRKGLATQKLLKAITEDVVNPGPYGDFSWDKALQGDAMTVLLKNRVQTWGPDMVFKLPCPNCTAQCETEIDLNEDLKIKPLPETSKAHVESDGILDVTLPGCKIKVEFRLLRGKDDKRLQKLQKQSKKERSSKYLRFRVTKIHDVPGNQWGEWLRELSAMDSSILRAAFDDADCGVDQEVPFFCESCNHEWTDDVRFRSDFLFPKYRAKKTVKQT